MRCAEPTAAQVASLTQQQVDYLQQQHPEVPTIDTSKLFPPSDASLNELNQFKGRLTDYHDARLRLTALGANQRQSAAGLGPRHDTLSRFIQTDLRVVDNTLRAGQRALQDH